MVLSSSINEPHLSTKMINSLEKTAIVAENHGVIPHNGAMHVSYKYTATLAVVYIS